MKLLKRAKRDALQLIETFVTKSNNPKASCESTRGRQAVLGGWVGGYLPGRRIGPWCRVAMLAPSPLLQVSEVCLRLCCTSFVYAEQFISKNFLPLLLEPVLGGYSRSAPAARNSEVLSVTIAIVTKLRGEFAPHVGQIMDSVVRFTLEMISTNTHDFPEFRVLLFKLLQEIVTNLPAIEPAVIKVMVDAVMFGLQHQQREVAEPVRRACDCDWARVGSHSAHVCLCGRWLGW